MKMRRMGLDTLRPGEQCVLRQIQLPAAQRMRLEELGLLPGTRIQCADIRVMEQMMASEGLTEKKDFA